MKIVTAAQIRSLEQAAVNAGATWPGLMEQAGWAIAGEALRLLGNPRNALVLILVGPGNNGGDGLVIARHLADAGAKVELYLWRRDLRPDPNRERCRERTIPENVAASDQDGKRLQQLLAGAQLIVDALLGIGVNRPVPSDLAAIMQAVNHNATAPVLAVDLASGIDADTGIVHGVAIRASASVATGALKRGMLLYPGRSYGGTLHIADIGLPSQHLEAIMSEQLSADLVRSLLPQRPDDSHKGSYGKAMVVAGSLYYPGAATLATAGALRVGAGLVTLATGRGALGAPGRLPEVTLRPLPDEGMGVLGTEAAKELLTHLEGYAALLIGPGLGHEEPTQGFLSHLLGLDTPKPRTNIGFRTASGAGKTTGERSELPPLVIDADGLNMLAQIDNWWERLPAGRAVLTPHPGEMKRLLKTEELAADLVSAAVQAAAQWKQIVVLKGATTIIAEPEGRSLVLDAGNAALATAGTGDVLAGAIAGLLTQGLSPFDAAACGVYLHSSAGRILREDLGDAGTIASDLLPRLPLAIKGLR